MLVVDLLKIVLGFAFIAMHLFNIFLLKKLRKKSCVRKCDSISLILLVVLFVAVFSFSVAYDFVVHQKQFTLGKFVVGLIIAYLQIVPAAYTLSALQKQRKDNNTNTADHSMH